MKKILKSIHPDDDLHYEKMGLRRGEVALWEDGSRVDGSRGSYEWWYYDSHYPDGTVLVLVFYSKMPIAVDGTVVERVSDPAVWELMYFGKSAAEEKYKAGNL